MTKMNFVLVVWATGFATLMLGCQPKSPGATVAAEHHVQAEAALTVGDFPRALAAAEQAVLYDPLTPKYQDLVNRVKLNAIAEATRPIRVEDGEALAYIAEAMSARDAKHLHIYQTALGRLQFFAGQQERAKDAYNKALAGKPGYWAASQGMAVYLESRGDLGAAVEHLRTSFSANSENLSLQSQLGNLLVRAGQLAEGIKLLNEVVETKPGVVAHVSFAKALMLDGHQQSAGAEFEKAVRFDPKSAVARVAFAEWLTEVGQFDAAKKQYDDVIKLGQAHVGRLGIGLVQLERGQPQEALESFANALDLNPNMVGVKYHAARAHEKLGNLEPARKLYESFLLDAGSLVLENESVEKARERLVELSKR